MDDTLCWVFSFAWFRTYYNCKCSGDSLRCTMSMKFTQLDQYDLGTVALVEF